MADQEQAKQLDSMTDQSQEKEVDPTKAQEAMSALATSTKAQQALAAQQVVSKQDVELIMSELEVTETVAIKTLREVAAEGNVSGEAMVTAALRKLVTS